MAGLAAECGVSVTVGVMDQEGRPLPAGQFVRLARWADACPHGPTVGQMRMLIARRHQNGLEAARAVRRVGRCWVVDVVAFGVWFRRRGGEE